MKTLLAIVFLVPFAADLLDRLVAWASNRWRVDVQEYRRVPQFRFWLWVRFIHDNPAMDHDLLVIALPSYEWALSYYDHRWRGEWCWHRREIYRRGRHWRDNGDGWQSARWGMELMPCE